VPRRDKGYEVEEGTKTLQGDGHEQLFNENLRSESSFGIRKITTRPVAEEKHLILV